MMTPEEIQALDPLEVSANFFLQQILLRLALFGEVRMTNIQVPPAVIAELLTDGSVLKGIDE